MFDLKKFRKDFNLKQSDLQEILGVNQSFISKIENGKESFPPFHLNKLFERYGKEIVSSYCSKDDIGSVQVVGDGNIANTGNIGGSVVMETGDEVYSLKAKIRKLEDEVKELKNDKAILQAFVSFLQNKK